MELLDEVRETLLKMSSRLDLLQDYILMKFGTLDFEQFARNRGGQHSSVTDDEPFDRRSRRNVREKGVVNPASVTASNQNDSPLPPKRRRVNIVNNEDENVHEMDLNLSTVPPSPVFIFESIKTEPEASTSVDDPTVDEFEAQDCEEALEDFSVDSGKTQRRKMNWQTHTCAVPGCSTWTRKAVVNLSWHSFPSLASYELKLQRRQWIDVLRNAKGNVEWNPKSSDTICSRHFKTECFLPSSNHRTLYHWAVPTQHLKDSVDDGSAKESSNDAISEASQSMQNTINKTTIDQQQYPKSSNTLEIRLESVKPEIGIYIEQDLAVNEFEDEDAEMFHGIDPESQEEISSAQGQGQATWMAFKIEPAPVPVEEAYVVNHEEESSDRPDFGPGFPQKPPNVAYKLWCPVCGRTFESTGSKSSHRLTHEFRKQCNFCDATYSSKWVLFRHMKTHHPEIL